MTEWSIYREVAAVWTEETSLIDCFVIDSIDRYARSAMVTIMADNSRDLLADYPTYTVIRIYYDDGAGDVLRMVGFVSSIESGKTSAKIEILGGDYWLRAREVFVTYTAQTKSYILQDLIENFTPIEWDASLVDVTNDDAITREWRGVRVDEIISEISGLSANEMFGCDDDFKFFFSPRDLTPGPQPFTDRNMLEATRLNNENTGVDRVTVYYNGTGAVSVENREVTAANQGTAGTDSPIVRTATYEHPEIGTEAIAFEKANYYLKAKPPLDLIEILTLGFPEIVPGMVMNITSTDINVSAEDFVVSEISFDSNSQETRMKMIENSDGVIDALTMLSTEKTRVDMKSMSASIVATESVVIDAPVNVKITAVEIYQANNDTGYFRFGAFGDGIGGAETGGKIGSGFLGYTKVVDESY